jgi:hypothetical protein
VSVSSRLNRSLFFSTLSSLSAIASASHDMSIFFQLQVSWLTQGGLPRGKRFDYVPVSRSLFYSASINFFRTAGKQLIFCCQDDLNFSPTIILPPPHLTTLPHKNTNYKSFSAAAAAPPVTTFGR